MTDLRTYSPTHLLTYSPNHMSRGRFALLTPLVFLAGCGQEAIDFNNQLAGIHARLGEAVEEFGRTLRPAIEEGSPPTAAELTAAIERLRGELAAAKERGNQLRAPDLPQASELYAAHQEFLAAQESLLGQELPEIERLLAEPITPGELEKRLKARFEAFKKAEASQLEAMHAAQRRFAEANGLKLTVVRP